MSKSKTVVHGDLFRTAYDGRQAEFSALTATDFTYSDDDIDHPSICKTVQGDARSTDINFIMKQYTATGLVPGSRAQPFYADLSAFPDFMEAQQIVIDGRNAFESLPAETRDYFRNSPEVFLEFMGNEENYDKAVALGLIEARPEPSNDPATPPAEPPLEGPADR